MRTTVFLTVVLVAVVSCRCGNDSSDSLSGKVLVDGSSTVFPVSEAVAEEFGKEHPGVEVTIGISGTGGGFKKFCAGETDLNDASRPISPTEVEKAKEKGIGFVELPVAYDGLSVLVNPKNDWVDHLTVAELKRIWEPGSAVKRWSDVRAGWPDRPISLYGPGPDSGTFDYFTEAVVGKSKASRPDYTASEDDNTLVRGIEGDENSLGYFGFAYYAANKARLKLVPVDPGAGPVLPSEETIENGIYAPLSRPIFIYVARKSADRPEVVKFVEFYLEHAPALAKEVGYVPLPAAVYSLAKKRFEKRVTGSVYAGRENTAGARLEEIFRMP